MNELELIASTFAISDDDAMIVLELVDLLWREDLVAEAGYARDSPTTRDLATYLARPPVLHRLSALARVEGLGTALVSAIDALR